MAAANPERDIQNVVMILKIFTKNVNEEVTLFYNSYVKYFSVEQVPPIQTFTDPEDKPTVVRVNRLQAIEYLKRKHSLYTNQELGI